MSDKKKEKKMHDELSDPKPHKAADRTVIGLVLDLLLGGANRLISLLGGLMAATLILYSGYVLVDMLTLQRNAMKTPWDLMVYKPEVIDDYSVPLGAPDLLRINENYRAWLTVYDTNIDYPVLQGEDNLYYASHDIYKQSSLTGAIYMAAANSPNFSDTYNVIYGHHMDNGAMFGGLDAFQDREYFDSHRDAIVVSTSGIYDVKLFAVATTDAYETRIYTAGNEMENVISFLKSGGEGGIGVGTEVLIFDEEAASKATRVLALSTCADATTSGRLVVFGVMTPRRLITLEADGYEGIYDGKEHSLRSVKVSHQEGTVVEYSLDGENWVTKAPSITDAGTMDVYVRATNPEYGTVSTVVQLKVHPRKVLLTSSTAQKSYDGKALRDSVIMVSGDGFLDGDGVTCVMTGSQKDAGTSPNSFTYVLQDGMKPGNYSITTSFGTLTVKPAVILIQTGSAQKEYDGSPLVDDEITVYGVAPGESIVAWTTGKLTTLGQIGNTYSLKWENADPKNYIVMEQLGTLTVVEATEAPPEKVTLTVIYYSSDGEELLPKEIFEMDKGEHYRVVPQAISGYVTVSDIKEGEIYRDMEIVILYSREEEPPEYVEVEEYVTPLGTGMPVYVQAGDCWD